MNAEHALVGAAILDPKVFTEVALKYTHFVTVEAQVVWKALGEMIEAGAEVDPITISDYTKGKLSPSEVNKFTMDVGIPQPGAWAKIVRNNFILRGIDSLTAGYPDRSDPGRMLTSIRTKLDRLEAIDDRELPTLASVSRAEMERIRTSTSEQLRGLPTGLGLERVVPGGIPRAKVTTIFGESGNFKTTVKNNLLLGMAKAGFRVLDVSLEDADDLTAHRFIARKTGINYGRIAAGVLTTEERASLSISEAALEYAENIILAGEIIPSIGEIIRTARYHKHKYGLDAVCIDYVQLLEGHSKQTQRELLDEIMRKCQLAAKRDDLAYIIVSQVKQDVDQRTDHRPRITDMIGSSSMRTASKLSLGVYRPGLYHSVPTKGSGYETLYHNHPEGHTVYENLLEIHFLKNVLGAPRVIIHCLVTPETGAIVPFDMRDYR